MGLTPPVSHHIGDRGHQPPPQLSAGKQPLQCWAPAPPPPQAPTPVDGFLWSGPLLLPVTERVSESSHVRTRDPVSIGRQRVCEPGTAGRPRQALLVLPACSGLALLSRVHVRPSSRSLTPVREPELAGRGGRWRLAGDCHPQPRGEAHQTGKPALHGSRADEAHCERRRLCCCFASFWNRTTGS